MVFVSATSILHPLSVATVQLNSEMDGGGTGKEKVHYSAIEEDFGNLLDINVDESIFNDDFPLIPDFPCMSSSSSSSSMPKPPPAAASLSSTASDVVDLIDNNEILNPSSVFPSEGFGEESDGFSFLAGNRELAMIFLEWLKQNRENISAEEMRSIKLNRSTIESASKRLGSTNEGKKQLLKLILEWVEQYQLQKKTIQISDPVPSPTPNSAYPTVAFLPPPPETASFPSPPINNGNLYPVNCQVMDGIPYGQTLPYPVNQFGHFPGNGNSVSTAQQAAVYGNSCPLFDPNGEGIISMGTSATKEARKRRMARQQKRFYHHRHSRNSNQHQNQLNIDQSLSEDGDDVSVTNWMCWSPSGSGGCSSPDRSPMHQQNHYQDDGKLQGFKTEKKLKFLLQKVLKLSDVSNLGRIVLPKKEAESHLPELESRDGISIAMEEIGTSRVWNMRYRYWPNNKSRMYLLENTGDFVRVNELQEGDFLVIYSDRKSGKFMIRGVKARQPGVKLQESKKTARRNTRSRSSSVAPSTKAALT